MGNVTSLWVTPFKSICSTELLIRHTAAHSKRGKLGRIDDIFVVIIYGLAFSEFATKSKSLKKG